MSVLYIRDENGKFAPIRTIKGKDGKDAPADVVRYGEQTLTPEQQEQARSNINAMSADVEIPSPYILPAATADTLGGVKVGNGLQMDGEVLGVKPEGVYELIETITFDENTIILSRTHTPSGEPYRFRDVLIRVWYNSEHSREAWIRMKVWFEDNKTLEAFKDNGSGTLTGLQGLRTSRHKNYIEIEISGITTNQGNIVPQNSFMPSNAYVISEKKIIRIDIDRQDGFFIGDTLSIYAVKE